MNITNQMMQQIDDIKNYESATNARLIKVPENELSGGLIELYYQTDNLSTRETVRNMFQNAGVSWLRKLITRDTSVSAVPVKELATTEDYLSMMVCNDSMAEFD